MTGQPADPLMGYECAHEHRWYMPPGTLPKGCPVCNTSTFKGIADFVASPDREPTGEDIDLAAEALAQARLWAPWLLLMRHGLRLRPGGTTRG